jgi:hypothetical protein
MISVETAIDILSIELLLLRQIMTRLLSRLDAAIC